MRILAFLTLLSVGKLGKLLKCDKDVNLELFIAHQVLN